MHLRCALQWPHHSSFSYLIARRYKLGTLLNDLWDEVYEDDLCLITTNADLGLITLKFLTIGTETRLNFDKWHSFLFSGFCNDQLLKIERDILDATLPKLIAVMPTIDDMVNRINIKLKYHKSRRVAATRARFQKAEEQRVLDFNAKYTHLFKLLEENRLICQYCNSSAKEFRAFPGTVKRKAYIVCKSCSTSQHP